MSQATSAPVGTAADAALARRRRALTAALVISAATTLVTGLAHSLGGGAAPDGLLLATAFVVTLLVLAPVLGARAGIARQLVAIALAQLLQHVLYSLPESGSTAGAHAHVHDAGAAMQSAAIVHEHAGMPIAHALAGLVTLALLRLVPIAVDAMLAAMSPRLAATMLRGTCPPARRRASVTTEHPARRRSLDVLLAALVTRGPPLALV